MQKLAISAAIAGLVSLPAAYGENNIPLPADYQTTFTNYISNDRIQNPDQTIRLFANDIALQGPDSGGKLPYGSVLVAEVYKARLDQDGEVMNSILNRRIRGDLALIAVMKREQGFGDGRAEGFETGDWDFAAYKPDGSDAGKDLNACRACHAPLAETNFLFSYEHLQ